jgi:hypothetical protein
MARTPIAVAGAADQDGDDDDTLGIHSQADRTIGERRRYAVAIAVQMDQARPRHALGVFDEAVERARKLHQAPNFLCPHVDDRAGLRAVQRLGHSSRQRVSSQSFSTAKEGKSRLSSGDVPNLGESRGD